MTEFEVRLNVLYTQKKYFWDFGSGRKYIIWESSSMFEVLLVELRLPDGLIGWMGPNNLVEVVTEWRWVEQWPRQAGDDWMTAERDSAFKLAANKWSDGEMERDRWWLDRKKDEGGERESSGTAIVTERAWRAQRGMETNFFLKS